jgi:hypothetical protein
MAINSKLSFWTTFCLTILLASATSTLAQSSQTAPSQNPTTPANPASNTNVTARPVGPTQGPYPPDDITRNDVAQMDRFLDDHREIAEQLRRDPSLINDQKWVAAHPALQDFLHNNPQIAQAFKADPNLFIHDAERYNQRDDISRRDVVEMNRFLDTHPEIAEQLRRDPRLVDNPQWVEAHPQLHEFLQSHPQLTAALRANPKEFMRDEYRYDQTGKPYANGGRNGELSSFGEFLGVHSNVAADLKADPSLATNKEYLATHQDLDEYLKAHPGVNDQLTQNPQAVMGSALVQKTGNVGSKPITLSPTPKQ